MPRGRWANRDRQQPRGTSIAHRRTRPQELLVHGIRCRRRTCSDVYSLIGSAKLNELDPEAYLRDVLTASPITPSTASKTSCPGTSPLNRPEPRLSPPDESRRQSRRRAGPWWRAKPGQQREGTYWGIRTDIAKYGLPNAMNCPYARTIELAATPTRLKAMGQNLKQRLVNWGYAVCDAALRKHVDPRIAAPQGFPFPAAGI